MNKKILASIFIIGLLAFGLGWGTYSYFSDTETSKGNVFTAGTIDIAVDGNNPWTKTYSAYLTDVKPCDTREFTFVITNPGGNPVKVWKHITNIVCAQGTETEPEKEEEAVTGARCWLPPYILYDLYVDISGDGQGFITIVDPVQQIRIDNINCMWIYLGKIPSGGSMTVKQSYHLASWEDAPVPAVTNWAQGDTMTFDIELYAEQVGGVGPLPVARTLHMENKDPTTWAVISDDISGDLTYDTGTGAFTFTGKAKSASTGYSLIYYADPWPGNGKIGLAGALLGSATSAGDRTITISGTLPSPIPHSDDKNYPVGGKIWLVLTSDYDGAKMTAWTPTEYLFEMHLITYP